MRNANNEPGLQYKCGYWRHTHAGKDNLE